MDHAFWNRVLMQFGGGSRSLLYTHTLQRDKDRDRDRVMDPNQSSASVSQEEFKLFHAIDRELYSLLVKKLWRDPEESMQIIALLMWLERTGFPNVIKKMVSLPYILINELADEAVSCLNCINNNTTTTTQTDSIFINNNTTTMDIPLIHCLMEKEISLQFFHQNRLHANREIKRILKEVCIRALKDIMQQSINERNKASTSQTQSPHMDNILSCVSTNSFQQWQPPSLQVVQAAPGFGLVGPVVGIGGDHVVPAEERTMFVTFSKGYPVYEWEVRDFFTRAYGDCIESLQMQEVQPNEQSLFARIVFHSASTIEVVLDGLSKAKFTINGKHVWVRKFVPKRPKSALSPTPPPPCCG